MNKIFILFTIFFIGSSNLFAQSALTKNDYEIYGEILRDLRREGVKNAKKKYSFVILNATEAEIESVDDYGEKKFRGLNKDFKRRNRVPLTFGKIFPVKYEYELISEPALEKLLSEGRKETEKISEEEKKENIVNMPRRSADWKYFYKKYPNSKGCYRFSAVGYSLNKRFAVVTVKGDGDSWRSNGFYLFKKIENKWVIFQSGFGFIVS